ncbi:MAG: TVP38/TMEM64 family protein [Planctomycetes bacterium]|nr:TVP38/TMEM64 family protein [Planctomycetota bacterium]
MKTIETKLVVFLATLASLLLAFKFLPINGYLGSFFETIQTLGAWGPVLLVGAYVVATVLMVPGTILSLGAGFAFGLTVGTLAVSIGSVLGALLAFLVGRNMARDFVEQKASQFPKFAAVDQAVQQAGFKIVLLTRLSPAFPFNVLNYLFSITKVRTRDYFFASWIGMLPGTIMYVYFGTAIKNLADLAAGRFDGGTSQKILLGVGLLATVAVTVYITRLARAAIREYVPSEVEEK